jgi:hypothetical protein
MSNQLNTVEVLAAKVVAPAVRELDLGIAIVANTTVRMPYGSMRMHQRAPRVVTAG